MQLPNLCACAQEISWLKTTTYSSRWAIYTQCMTLLKSNTVSEGFFYLLNFILLAAPNKKDKIKEFSFVALKSYTGYLG